MWTDKTFRNVDRQKLKKCGQKKTLEMWTRQNFRNMDRQNVRNVDRQKLKKCGQTYKNF